MAFEGLFGFLLGIKIAKEKLTKAIPSLSKLHMVVGILLYVLTKVENTIGLYLYKAQWLNYFAAYYAVLLTIIIVQEYRYRKKHTIRNGNHKVAYQEDSYKEKHRKLMALLNNNSKNWDFKSCKLTSIIAPVFEIFQDPELKKLKWAVFEDKVFEMSKFDHPGGNFILNEVNGN